MGWGPHYFISAVSYVRLCAVNLNSIILKVLTQRLAQYTTGTYVPLTTIKTILS